MASQQSGVTASRLTVCFVTPYSFERITGVGRFVMDLSRQLKGRDVDSITVSPAEGTSSTFVHFTVKVRWRVFANVELAIKSAVTILRLRRRFHVVHVQHAHLQSAATCLVARVLGKPSVLTLHGQVPEPSEPWRATVHRSAERWSLILANARVAVSPFVAKAFEDRKIPVETVWNGVDTELFRPSPQIRVELRRRLGFTSELVFIYAGRWARTKGLDILVRGLGSLPTQTRPFVLLVLGEPSPEDPELLEKAVKLGDARSHVRIIGLANGSLPDYLAAADVFVLPSLYEGMPLGLLEAMSSGLPCLVSDIPVSAAIVADAKCGWTFRSGDLDDLKRILAEIVSNGAPVQLAQNARKAATRDYDLDRVVQSYLNLYRRLSSGAQV